MGSAWGGVRVGLLRDTTTSGVSSCDDVDVDVDVDANNIGTRSSSFVIAVVRFNVIDVLLSSTPKTKL